MPEVKHLIPPDLASVGPFRRDLETFLSLSPAQLSILSELADSEEGYSLTMQTAPLSDRTGLSSDKTRAVIRVADFLYERCREQRITPEEAAEELIDIGASLSVEDLAAKKEALQEVVAPKDRYEREGYARRRTLSVLAHFHSLDAVWDIRPIFHRETGELIREVPIIIMNFSWHDSAGHHNAYFQLDIEDWVELRGEMERLEDQLGVLQKYIEKHQ